jgi:serine/threonine protein kinase
LYGRHGDIKPENILWSDERIKDKEDHLNEEGLLLIADFGLMDFRTRVSRSKILAENIHGSPTYAPPESRLRKNISRAYDIWSLGCVYLEFLTWLVCGWEDLKRFSPVRGETGPVHGMARSNKINDDCFFTIVNDESGKPLDAAVRDTVKEWMKDLHEKPRCSMFINDFLNLISEKMLVIDPQERISCAQLNKELHEMMRKAEDRSDYLTIPRSTSPRDQRQNPMILEQSRGTMTTQSPRPKDGSPLPKCPLIECDSRPTSPPMSPQIEPEHSTYLRNLSPSSSPQLEQGAFKPRDGR